MNKALLAACLAVCFGVSGLSRAQSNADSLIHQIKALKDPADGRDQSAPPTAAMYEAVAAYAKKKDDLIMQLYKAAPSDQRSIDYMQERWSQGLIEENIAALMGGGEPSKSSVQALIKKVSDDIDSVLSANPPEGLKEPGSFLKLSLQMSGDSLQDPASATNQFVKQFPTSAHCAELLLQAAQATSTKPDEKIALLRRIEKDYPTFKHMDDVKAALKVADMYNKPFELKFNDAITGQPIDVAQMKGKVVLVDFWATWCGPCVAEMPLVKKAYDTYHTQGLVVVGVSLDNPAARGGLDQLKKFVKDNQIPWTQYYQGNGWNSKFSSGWGINSIPAMFAVDKKGNFVGTVDPRDDGFEPRVKELLAEK